MTASMSLEYMQIDERYGQQQAGSKGLSCEEFTKRESVFNLGVRGLLYEKVDYMPARQGRVSRSHLARSPWVDDA
jgi:hypothetical protein